MNCKKCGFQLTENDQFCKNCGTPVDNTSVQNNNEGLGNQNTQTYTQLDNTSVQNNNEGLGNQNTQTYTQQQSVSQQPMNNYNGPAMQQPSWTSGYNAQPINQAPKNSNTKFIMIGIIVVVAIVGIIIAIGAFGGNNSNSSYTVKFNGFTLKVPTNLVYKTESDTVIIGDEEGTWAAYIELMEGSYSQLLSNKSQLQSVYQSKGCTSSAAVEKTIGGMSVITLEISQSGTNFLLGFAKANSMNLFGIAVYNMNNEYDYKLLETVSSILSSAEYTGATNNIGAFEKPNMSGIAELAK